MRRFYLVTAVNARGSISTHIFYEHSEGGLQHADEARTADEAMRSALGRGLRVFYTSRDAEFFAEYGKQINWALRSKDWRPEYMLLEEVKL